ncbi:hypothetical protein H7198_05890 [Fructobacillus sp. CRL 2054]|uniref:hypothetical protein n=1 Tax=Fructobacillus sp. CRL 2054 TaxID=2763007 RepID=UPI002379F6B6|nr:hypothetical protein [Fructobacillus sp. CRL 2054]MDD9139131.1 hypothetical protein [Fructobacillus sp. CRL 2054]
MERLSFEVFPIADLVDTSQLNAYSCGVVGLDDFIQYKYQEFEKMHLTKLSAVYVGHILVGMFA